jgi:SNF2 family DNA or RNA helicase
MTMNFKTALLQHQQLAYDKLRHLKIGALYMDMGVGKTRTALELIALRLESGKINQVLWLCPCSVKSTIKAELQKHVDGDLSMFTIEGIESMSQSDRLYLRLLDLVANQKVFLIVDESNLVKNHFAKRTKRISALAKSCAYRLILNGTPVSKNEADLFAQWYILDERILGYHSFWSFAANHLEYDDYGKVRRVLNVDYLTEKISPYSYGVKKEECIILPRKRYRERDFALTEEQEYAYYDAKEQLLADVDEFDSTTIYKLFTGLQQVTSGRAIVSIYPLKSIPFFDNPLDNPRIKALLQEVDDVEEKIIIWCKFKHEIDDVTLILRDRYGADGVAQFYGGINQKSRIAEMERFKNDAQYLIAHKVCGGYGLNLQFCSHMIYYNNDFNWATRAQSEDRVHRLGQTKEVTIVDICAASKIDDRIINNLNCKGVLCDRFKDELKKNRDNKAALSAWIDGGRHDKNRAEPEGKAEGN